MPKATILAVDDDQAIQMVVDHYLTEDGYKVVSVSSGAELRKILPDTRFDAVLLDLVLPDAEGFSLIGVIREYSQAPIIIVSGKSDTTEKIVGLEMGADDYITKPFEMRELSARIKAALRRAPAANMSPASPANGVPEIDRIHFEDWCLDRAQYQLYGKDNESADLTTGEFRLLEALVLSPNRTLSREYLFELTREGKFDAFDRAIDIQIARIRKKIGDDPKTPRLIKTVRGIGYMFCGEARNAA